MQKFVYVHVNMSVLCSDCDEVLEAESLMSWQRDVPVQLRMAESGPLSDKPICVMTALRATAEHYPNHPALGLYELSCSVISAFVCASQRL